MSYQLYRNTTLGNSLQESLDELIQVIHSYFLLFMFNVHFRQEILLSGREKHPHTLIFVLI